MIKAMFHLIILWIWVVGVIGYKDGMADGNHGIPLAAFVWPISSAYNAGKMLAENDKQNVDQK